MTLAFVADASVDAAYLELAERRKLVFGCKDARLQKAARAAGLRLWT